MSRVNVPLSEKNRKEFEATSKQYCLNMSEYAAALISTEIGVDCTEFGRSIMEKELDVFEEVNASITLSREQEASLNWLAKKYGMTKNNVIKMLYYSNRGKIKNKKNSPLILSSRNDYIECSVKDIRSVNKNIMHTQGKYYELVQAHYSLIAENQSYYDTKINPISGFAAIYRETKKRVKGRGDFKRQAMMSAWKMWGKNELVKGPQNFKISKKMPVSFGRSDIRKRDDKTFYIRLFNGSNWYWEMMRITNLTKIPNSSMQIDINSLGDKIVRIIF